MLIGPTMPADEFETALRVYVGVHFEPGQAADAHLLLKHLRRPAARKLLRYLVTHPVVEASSLEDLRARAGIHKTGGWRQHIVELERDDFIRIERPNLGGHEVIVRAVREGGR